MYHPSRGGVRGGRDQFSWDDVKVDKHRENFLGHSIKAPVGRWQKGKDLNWYAKDKKSKTSNADALKEEINRIKEEEEQAMREALGLAPKRSHHPQGNRLDKHEFSELVKRGSTAEDVGAGHSEAAWVHGLGYASAPRPWEDPSTLPSNETEDSPKQVLEEEAIPDPPSRQPEEDKPEDESSRKKRRREEKKPNRERRNDKHERHERRHSRDSDRRHKKDKHNRRHYSD